MSTIKLTCSENDLFLIATYLVKQSSGDGDCTIVCSKPKELANKYERSRLKPKDWERNGNVFAIDQEGLDFTDEKDAKSFTFKIFYEDWNKLV